MKKLILILTVVLPSLLFAQDISKGTFTIKKEQPLIYLTSVDSNYWDETISVKQLLKAGKIEVVTNSGSSVIVKGFTMSILYHEKYAFNTQDIISKSDSITKSMREKLRVAEWIVIKYVICTNQKGNDTIIGGLALKIDSTHKIINKNIHYPIICASLGNNRMDSITKDSLFRIGRIEASGENEDSYKILSFTMGVSEGISYIPFYSKNAFITKEMIDYLSTHNGKRELRFSNIRCQLPNGNIKILVDFYLLLKE